MFSFVRKLSFLVPSLAMSGTVAAFAFFTQSAFAQSGGDTRNLQIQSASPVVTGSNIATATLPPGDLPPSPMAPNASRRVALVVGNSKYLHSPLANPRNDAEAMAQLLVKAGFEVEKVLDTDLAQLQSAVNRFGIAIRDSNTRFGLFYYAGHGVQLDWRNYVVPVSANIQSAADIPKQAVDISYLLKFMGQASGRSYLVILDACRDNPFADNYKPAAKGLSQFDAPVGSLLAYSTSPGTVAMDGQGDNGLYTGFLLKEFSQQGTRIEDAFKRVRLNVRMASEGRQIPWESTSLEEDVYLFPTPKITLSESDKDRLLEKELAAWFKVKTSNDPKVLAAFIREFPSGSASELAQSRLNRILAAADVKTREQQRLKAEAAAKLDAAKLAAQEHAAHLESQRQAERQAIAEKVERERQKKADLAAAAEAARVEKAAQEAARKAEAARMVAERAKAAKDEADRLAAAQIAAKAEAERIAVTKARERAAAAESARAERQRQLALELAADDARKERIALEAAQRADAARVAERAEAERRAAARLQAQKAEEARITAERLRAEEEARIAAVRAEELAQAEKVKRALQLAAEQEALAQREQAEKEAAEQALRQQLAIKEQVETQARETAQAAAQALLEQQRLALAAQAELASLVLERQRATEATPTPGTLAPTPYFRGYAEHQRRFVVGDEYRINISDGFTKLAKAPRTMRVTEVDPDNDRVVYNNGEFASDLMGNVTANDRGSLDTPRQFYPAELIVGKRWTTRFKQKRPNGETYTFEYKVRVVGKETVTVPAGTFDTFRIEASGFNVNAGRDTGNTGASIQRTIWVAPGVAMDIAQDIKVRLSNGRWDQNDRWELASIRLSQ